MSTPAERIEYPGYRPIVPWPDADANKYTRGKLIVVGGSAAYPGAAALAALAGQRMGAGYVEVACDPECVSTVRASGLSLVVRPWGDIMQGGLPSSRKGKPLAYVVGPGFDASQSFEMQLLERVLTLVEAPVLIDGGALGCLAASTIAVDAVKAREKRGLATVLTPHGGEALQLADAFGVEPVARNADSRQLIDFACALSKATGSVLALKGPDTFVAEGDLVLRIAEGTAALAKAGTGDVLAGLIGGYLAQGFPAFDAAASGVLMHAKAGCVAADRVTSISVVPEDVIAFIPEAIRCYDGC